MNNDSTVEKVRNDFHYTPSTALLLLLYDSSSSYYYYHCDADDHDGDYNEDYDDYYYI